MILKTARQFIAAILVFTSHSYTFAQPSTAMLYPNGAVQVDGVSVNSAVAVTGGQSISVGSGGANITAGTTSIMAVQDTVLKFISPNQIAISQGGVFVNTVSQVKTDLGACGSVTSLGNGQSPGNFLTKYEVQMRGNNAYVYARDLQATLQAGSRTITLQPQTYAIVSNFNSARCSVAYYNNLEAIPSGAKAIFLAAAVAPVIIIPTVFSQKISAEKP